MGFRGMSKYEGFEPEITQPKRIKVVVKCPSKHCKHQADGYCQRESIELEMNETSDGWHYCSAPVCFRGREYPK